MDSNPSAGIQENTRKSKSNPSKRKRMLQKRRMNKEQENGRCKEHLRGEESEPLDNK